MINTVDDILAILENPLGETGVHDNSYIIFRMLQGLHKANNGLANTFLDSVAKQSVKYEGLTPRQAQFVAKNLIPHTDELFDIAQAKKSAPPAPLPVVTPGMAIDNLAKHIKSRSPRKARPLAAWKSRGEKVRAFPIGSLTASEQAFEQLLASM